MKYSTEYGPNRIKPVKVVQGKQLYSVRFDLMDGKNCKLETQSKKDEGRTTLFGGRA